MMSPKFFSGRFSNQVVVVTGGSRGIGFGISKRLGQEGAKVVIMDQNKEQLLQSEKDLQAEGIKCMTYQVDVSNFSQVQDSIKRVLDKFGQVDVLVQSAGITGKTGIKSHEVDFNDFQRVNEVNVNGMFHFCKSVLPPMLQRNYGRIVNIASVAGKEGNAGMLAYSASKAAVISMTKVIGKEYAETGITCNAIAPAVIRTAMVAALPEAQVKYMTDKIPMKRTGEIEEITALACFVASTECSFTTAFCFDATGGRSTY